MLTELKAKAVVTALCTDHPDRVNPVSVEQGGCLNTDPHDESCHCLASEVLVSEGIDLPPVDSNLNGVGINSLWGDWPPIQAGVTVEARSFLAYVQATADGVFEDDQPMPWGKALERLREDGKL